MKASSTLAIKSKVFGDSEEKATPGPILAAYVCFCMAAALLYRMVKDSEDAFAAFFTAAEMLQCLAMVLLAAQVLVSGSVESISGRAIALEALALACRLSSTLFYNGYLPADKSGDWLYQTIDSVALLVAIWLLYQIFVQKRLTYMESADTCPVFWLTACCFVAAAAFHSNMDLNPLMDTIWMAGLNLGTMSVLPQLWLIKHVGGRVAALTCHNIVVMAVGRTLAGYFMWLARGDIDCTPWIKGVNHAQIAILGMSFLHVVLVANFAYLYVKALLSQGLHCQQVFLDAGPCSELAPISKKTIRFELPPEV